MMRSWSSALRGMMPGSSANVCHATERGTWLASDCTVSRSGFAVGRGQDHVVEQLVGLRALLEGDPPPVSALGSSCSWRLAPASSSAWAAARSALS